MKNAQIKISVDAYKESLTNTNKGVPTEEVQHNVTLISEMISNQFDICSVVPQHIISNGVNTKLIRMWKELDVETQKKWMQQVR